MAQVEADHTVYGDECKFGGGKVLREGMGQATGVGAGEALDLLVTNALIIDASVGIIKADIGIKGNRIVGVGKAGNPDVMSGVTPGMVAGVTTEVLAGEKMIVTAGALDTHVHYICPQIVDEVLASGDQPLALTLTPTLTLTPNLCRNPSTNPGPHPSPLTLHPSPWS